MNNNGEKVDPRFSFTAPSRLPLKPAGSREEFFAFKRRIIYKPTKPRTIIVNTNYRFTGKSRPRQTQKATFQVRHLQR